MKSQKGVGLAYNVLGSGTVIERKRKSPSLSVERRCVVSNGCKKTLAHLAARIKGKVWTCKPKFIYRQARKGVKNLSRAVWGWLVGEGLRRATKKKPAIREDRSWSEEEYS